MTCGAIGLCGVFYSDAACHTEVDRPARETEWRGKLTGKLKRLFS